MSYYTDPYLHWQIEWQSWARKYTITEPLELVNSGEYFPELDEQLFTLAEALEWIEKFYREQKVTDSVVDQVPEAWVDHDYTPAPRVEVPAYVPRPGGLNHQVVSEPPRVLTGNDLVMNPIAEQAPSRRDRLEEYGARVGFQR